MTIDVSKISNIDGRIIARQFLQIFERDWENPKIRADFEIWKKQREKEKADEKNNFEKVIHNAGI